MSVDCISIAKPVTLKRNRPNALFQEWLKELLEEATHKRCKLEHQIAEALSSLSKYPLPLNTGAECRILKGFDSRLCDFIEQRIKEQNSNKNKANQIVNEHNFDNFSHITKEDFALNKVKCEKYITQFICYSSIMIALMKLRRKDKLHVSMTELLNQAVDEIYMITKKLLIQKLTLTDCPLIFQSIKEFISVESSMDQFFLTDKGVSEAYYLSNILDERKDDVIISVNTKSVTPVNNSEPATLEDVTVEMIPGSYDIILLIDKNETSGASNKNDPTVTQFKKYSDLKHEYRSLKVGDFAWIARHKVDENQELVLPYIAERKRLDDLSASIKDGRFHEQKFRLRRCGLANVIYLVENYASKKHVGLPVQTLMQALANTRIQDGFKVHITDSLCDSIRFLAMITKRLTIEYRDKTLKGRNAEGCNNVLMTFEYFNRMSVKSKPLTVTETFIKMLLQLKGLSVEKALAITKVYRTPKSLIKAYEHLDREKGEMLLAHLKYSELSRSVGPVVSKSIYHLFSSFDIH